MTAFMIVEIEVRGKTRSCLVHRVVGPEEHLLVLDAAPAALAVLAYADLVLFEHGEERFARELGALISVEDLGSAEPLDRLVERIHTEVRHQGVGQAPGKHRPARPVNDRHEVEKPPPAYRDVGDVGGSHLVGVINDVIAQEVGKHPVRLVGGARAPLLI